MKVRNGRKDVLCLLCLAAFVGHFTLSAAGYSWWSLGVQSCATAYTECGNCSDSHLLRDNQKQLCNNHGNTELLRAIAQGVRESISNCKHQFGSEKWDCAILEGDHLFGLFAESGTPERAILSAFMNAGAAHGIASACHENLIDGCQCETQDTQREDSITYLQSCADNVDFAISFLRNFNRETEIPSADQLNIYLMDQWNNELGYEAVNNRATYCRCTGLSGSCALQTCYLKAPTIQEIGNSLRPKYASAQKVTVNRNRNLRLVEIQNIEPLDHLPIYLIDPPNFCDSSPSKGILGTAGRLCNPTADQTNPQHCDNLCCGRGYDNITHVESTAKCTFVWCCKYICTTTSSNVTKQVCH